MTEIAFNDRPFDLFVSYSHKDHEQVAPVARWLREVAKVKVWWDERSLDAGATIETALPAGIQAARGVLFAVSKHSASSGWVQGEFGLALKERTQHREFRVICLSIDGTEPPAMAATTKWLPLTGGAFNADIARQVLAALYGAGEADVGGRDVYVSRSWRPSEAALADNLCRQAMRAGWRLVGDAGDQPHFDEATRIRSLIASCGALIAAVPNRGGSGRTSRFIEEEIRIAFEVGIPVVAVCDPGIALADDLTARLTPERRYDSGAGDAAIAAALETLAEEFKAPPHPHYVFYATSLRADDDAVRSAQRLLSQVTGIECAIGADLGGQGAQKKIVELIRRALFVVADVSDGHLNTLIEAGIALGAGTPLYLLAKGEPRPTRFMFRDIEVNFYRDPLDLYGAVHREARKYRRRILNRELAGNGWF